MKAHIHKHLKYYITLISMQILGLFVLSALSGNKEFQVTVIVISGIGYIIWAILHQYLEHSLTAKIVVEYVLFGIFGIIGSLLFFK